MAIDLKPTEADQLLQSGALSIHIQGAIGAKGRLAVANGARMAIESRSGRTWELLSTENDGLFILRQAN
jgi:light-regulated signal transduction histidine kinase (bacteriophytochrome)